MIFDLLRKRSAPADQRAEAIYASIVAAARRQGFYADLAAPDTFPGRFELVVLHAALVLRRLRRETGGDQDKRGRDQLGQHIFDAMFRALDANLREIGIGDMAVPKRIKAMVRSFFDGAKTYDAALDAGDEESLAKAVSKNVFGDTPSIADAPRRVAAYMTRADAALAEQSLADLIASGPTFPPLETEAA